jgi:FkbM family methyltransferase
MEGRAALEPDMTNQTRNEPWRCLFAYNELGGYAVPLSSSTRNCSQYILNGRVFEPRMPDFVAAHVGVGDIVHAGTFFGDFLPAFSRALAPGARVWAFEPVAENHACARLTLEMNRIDNVTLTFAGLGRSASEGVMVTTDAAGMAMGEIAYVSTSATDQVGDTEAIRIVSIDETVPADRQVSIIQLDVEGFEEQALEGALKTIARCRPILVLEGLPSVAWVERHLTPLGYKVREGIHANVVLSVRPTGSLIDTLRWRSRSLLKAVLPAALRRRVRETQAAQRPSRLPTAQEAGALDCQLLTTDAGHVVCAPPGADVAACAVTGSTAAGELVAYGVGYGQDLPGLASSGVPVRAVEADADKCRYARMTSILNRLDSVRVETSPEAFEAKT